MKINTSNFLGNVDATFFVEVLTQSMKLYTNSEDLIINVEDSLKDSSNFNADLGYEILTRFEDLMDSNLSQLERFYEGRVSGYPELNRRLKDVLINFNQIKRVISPLLDEFVPLTFEESKGVLKYLKFLVGHLCIFIRKQFELEDYLAGNEPEFSLEVYMSNMGLTFDDVKSLNIKLAARAIAYRPKIAIFEEYPQLEQPFFDRVGEEFYDLEYLNVQYVLDVVNDKMSAEDLLKLIYEEK